MADRPPGRDGNGPQAVTPIPGGRRQTTSTPPSAEGTSTVAHGADSGRDLDADLSVIHDSADSLGPWLAIWAARREPDAHARRCASDAIDAIDAALAALHRVRARLVGEVRQADDAAADRADRLLAETRPAETRPKGPALADHTGNVLLVGKPAGQGGPDRGWGR
jgi:hypothetical protein